MENGWDGVGFLLGNIRQDKFEALCGCLQNRKYDKFLDLIDGVSPEVVRQTDNKGRNLLLILTRYLSELQGGSSTRRQRQSAFKQELPQEFKRAIDVIKILTKPVNNKK